MPKSLSTMTEWIHAAGVPRAAGDMEITAEYAISADAPPVDGKPATRTFSMNAYNGGELNLAGWRAPVVVDLAGMDTRQSHRPILIDHKNDLEHLLGQTDSITKTATSVAVTGRIHAHSPTARQVVALHDDGFKFQASIGAKPVSNQFIPAGQTANANGRTFNGPINIVRKSVLGEVSFVRLGADDTTSARIAAQAAKDSTMGFEQWLTAKGFTLAELSDAQKATLTAMFDAETADKPATDPKPKTVAASAAAGSATDEGTEDPIATLRAGYATEQKRINAINTVHTQFGNKHPDIAAKAIEDNWSPDQFKIKMYESAPRVTAGSSAGSNRTGLDGAVILAATCMAGGITNKTIEAGLPAADRERVMNDASSSKYRGMTIQALMDMTIAANGGSFHGSRKSNDFIRAAFEADMEIKASGFSTMSFSGILNNVANKALIDSYTAVETVWQYIAAVRSMSDFKPAYRFRLDPTGAFKKVGPDGELKHVGMTDTGYTTQLDTYGAIVALTRKMMIDDDLGAFLQFPQFLGQMGAQRIEEAVMVLLLNNTPTFFSTGNKNLSSGTGSALSIDALSAAETAFRNQVGPNGKPIGTTPKILLVPTNLKVPADQIFRSQLLITSATGATAPIGADNPHAGKYQPYTSPYLNNTAITDQDGKKLANQSTTAYYLFADPKIRAALIVGFLNGQQTPTIESAQTDFNTLGMQWRAYEDFGVGYEDPVAALKMAGA